MNWIQSLKAKFTFCACIKQVYQTNFFYWKWQNFQLFWKVKHLDKIIYVKRSTSKSRKLKGWSIYNIVQFIKLCLSLVNRLWESTFFHLREFRDCLNLFFLLILKFPSPFVQTWSRAIYVEHNTCKSSKLKGWSIYNIAQFIKLCLSLVNRLWESTFFHLREFRELMSLFFLLILKFPSPFVQTRPRAIYVEHDTSKSIKLKSWSIYNIAQFIKLCLSLVNRLWESTCFHLREFRELMSLFFLLILKFPSPFVQFMSRAIMRRVSRLGLNVFIVACLYTNPFHILNVNINNNNNKCRHRV